jgi:hypothetical protein
LGAGIFFLADFLAGLGIVPQPDAGNPAVPGLPIVNAALVVSSLAPAFGGGVFIIGQVAKIILGCNFLSLLFDI